MLRTTFLRNVTRAASAAAIRPTAAAAIRRPMPSMMWTMMRRAYSTENGLNRADVEVRIIDVLKSFDKVSSN